MPGSVGFIPARSSRQPIEVPRRPVPPRSIRTKPPGETKQTSYRLSGADRERLRLIALHMENDVRAVAGEMPGMEVGSALGKLTMSVALRALIREKAKELGIVVEETELGRNVGVGRGTGRKAKGAVR